ncbi:MAG: type II secretion system protein [Pyrinomonadaceae bacterium]
MNHFEIKRVCPEETARNENGFSIVELLITFMIIAIMSGAVAFYLNATEKLHKADDAALTIIDVMQEARQRSLTQRETMRVAIDKTTNTISLIDENSPTTANDDVLLRTVTLPDANLVSIGDPPGEISANPPEPFPVPTIDFKFSSYPSSNSHTVATLRFQSNGSIVDAGNSPTGSGAVSSGSTLHVWSKSDDQDGVTDTYLVSRAITTIGTTGSIRLWEYNPKNDPGKEWQDSRLTGTFGGQTTGG